VRVRATPITTNCPGTWYEHEPNYIGRHARNETNENKMTKETKIKVGGKKDGKKKIQGL
jgi:hypothetical protein